MDFVTATGGILAASRRLSRLSGLFRMSIHHEYDFP